ncbi:ShKT domain [Trinorchestia longiramus]|nr:ShKT domain [Trinorchestia longiramus]
MISKATLEQHPVETWCVWVLHSDQCRAPVLTLVDFDFGPRDSRRHCTYDYLEIRTNSSSDGEVKCEKEVAPGTEFRALGHTMILYFNGELGGYRGFEARLKFENIPGCCRKIVNGTETHWLSPGYPEQPKMPFNCTVQLHNPDPAKLEFYLQQPKKTSEGVEECQLELCLPDGTCSRYCVSATDDDPVAVLPNSGSTHTLSGSVATHLTVKTIPTPCHQVIQLGGNSDRAGAVEVLATNVAPARKTMCEYRFQSATDDHVKLVVQKVLLNGSNALLAVDEGGAGEYLPNTTRSYSTGDVVPHEFISANSSIAVTLQGGSGTHLTLQYFLYECQDEEEECQYWKLDGECTRNSRWMSQHCPVSCLSCNVTKTCRDRHLDCAFWAQHGQCEDNERWMAVHCSVACGHCPTCEDLNPQCSAWAATGECSRNTPYMRVHCPATCKLCEKPPEVKNTSSTTVKPDVRDDVENDLHKDSNTTLKTAVSQTNIEENEIIAIVSQPSNAIFTEHKINETSRHNLTSESDINDDNLNEKETKGDQKSGKNSTVLEDIDDDIVSQVEKYSLLESFLTGTNRSNNGKKHSTGMLLDRTPHPTAEPVSFTPHFTRRVNAHRAIKRFRNFRRQTPSSSNSLNSRVWTTRKPFRVTGDKITSNRTLSYRHQSNRDTSIEQSRIPSPSFRVNSTLSSNLAYKLKKNELQNESNLVIPSHFNDVTFGIVEHSLPNHSQEVHRKRVPFSLDSNINSTNRSSGIVIERKFRKRLPLNLATSSQRNRNSKFISNKAGLTSPPNVEKANKTQSSSPKVYTNLSECFSNGCAENSVPLERIVSNFDGKQGTWENSTSSKEKLDFLQYLNNFPVRNTLQSIVDNSTDANFSEKLSTEGNKTSLIDSTPLNKDETDDGKNISSTHERKMDVQEPSSRVWNSNQIPDFDSHKKHANQEPEINAKSSANQRNPFPSSELELALLPTPKRKVSHDRYSQHVYRSPTTSPDNFTQILTTKENRSNLITNIATTNLDSQVSSSVSSVLQETFFSNASEVTHPRNLNQSSMKNSGESFSTQKANLLTAFIQPTTSPPTTTVQSTISMTFSSVPQFQETTHSSNLNRIKASTNNSPITTTEKMPSSFKLPQTPRRADRNKYGHRRIPPRAFNYDVVGREVGAGNLFRRKHGTRTVSPAIYHPRHGHSTENEVMFPTFQSSAVNNQKQVKRKLHHINYKTKRPLAPMSIGVSESAANENERPSAVLRNQSQNLVRGSNQPTTSNPFPWSAESRRLVSHGRSRRNYIKFIKTFKNKEAVIDSFMMLPFCSDIKRLERRSLSSLRSSASLSNHIKYNRGGFGVKHGSSRIAAEYPHQAANVGVEVEE